MQPECLWYYCLSQNSCSPNHYVTVGKVLKILSLNLLTKDVQNHLSKAKLSDYFPKTSKHNVELNAFESKHMCIYKDRCADTHTFLCKGLASSHQHRTSLRDSRWRGNQSGSTSLTNHSPSSVSLLSHSSINWLQMSAMMLQEAATHVFPQLVVPI